jgi:hypothetical protein
MKLIKDGELAWYPILDENGTPDSSAHKTAQDMAYIIAGFTAHYFVTNDDEDRKEINQLRNLIMEGSFWDKDKSTIKDALTSDLMHEVEFEAPGNDLVALLDQINAYMLLYQNITPIENEQVKYLNDMRKLCDRIIDGFYGFFWNTDINRTDYQADHIDVGHTLKTYWMLYEIDKRWYKKHKIHLYKNILDRYVESIFDAAYGNGVGPWGKKFSGSYSNVLTTNPDWWIHAECDQFAASLSLIDKSYVPMLETTSKFWLNKGFIDKGRSVRGIREGIKWDGTLYGDEYSWTSKANSWKNGYHETEHALILYLVSCSLNSQAAYLFYAVPESKINSFIPKPYIFDGKEISRDVIGKMSDSNLFKVKVGFTDIE